MTSELSSETTGVAIPAEVVEATHMSASELKQEIAIMLFQKVQTGDGACECVSFLSPALLLLTSSLLPFASYLLLLSAGKYHAVYPNGHHRIHQID